MNVSVTLAMEARYLWASLAALRSATAGSEAWKDAVADLQGLEMHGSCPEIRSRAREALSGLGPDDGEIHGGWGAAAAQEIAAAPTDARFVVTGATFAHALAFSDYCESVNTLPDHPLALSARELEEIEPGVEPRCEITADSCSPAAFVALMDCWHLFLQTGGQNNPQRTPPTVVGGSGGDWAA